MQVPKVINVHEAKTHLSRLLDEVALGEDIILARNGTPVARLVAFTGPPERELGFVAYDVPETFFEPLPEEELIAWQTAKSTS